MDNKKIKSALISVFYKDGLEDIVRALDKQGVTIYSTGGTYKAIEAALGADAERLAVLGKASMPALGQTDDFRHVGVGRQRVVHHDEIELAFAQRLELGGALAGERLGKARHGDLRSALERQPRLAEDIDLLAAIRAIQIAIILDEAQNRNIHHICHINCFFNNYTNQLLW